mmetsp:Transcript_5108/g.8763  ORF Transcript_5108/g.8763 Transcript_5108/m.8763 type:complete len:80 (+) Transcript_5108:696-935(+)
MCRKGMFWRLEFNNNNNKQSTFGCCSYYIFVLLSSSFTFFFLSHHHVAKPTFFQKRPSCPAYHFHHEYTCAINEFSISA